MKRLLLLLLCAYPLSAGTLVTYWVDPCTDPATGCQKDDPALAEAAFSAWVAISDGSLHIIKARSREQALLRLTWVGGAAGRYGEMEPITVNGQPGAELHIRPDLASLGPTIASAGRGDSLFRDTVVFLTCVHETGHALGLRHTAEFADIMYSFQYGGDFTQYFTRYRRQIRARADFERITPFSDNDVRTLRINLLRRERARP